MVPSLDPSESERPSAQNLTPLDSSPWCTPHSKNVPPRRVAVSECDSRATALGPCTGHAPSAARAAAELWSSAGRNPHQDQWGRFMFVHAQHPCGAPCTFPGELVLTFGVCKVLRAEAGFTTKGRRECRGGRAALCPGCGGAT